MKNLRWAIMLVLAMMLAASTTGCVSGGGGGGGAGGGGAVLGSGNASGIPLNPPQGGGLGGGGESVKDSPPIVKEDILPTKETSLTGMSTDKTSITLEVKGDTVLVSGIGGSIDIPMKGIERIESDGMLVYRGPIEVPDGTVRATARLGKDHTGIPGGLQYAQFGEWLAADLIDPREDKPGYKVTNMYEGGAFAVGDQKNHAAVMAANANFTGTALASAYSLVYNNATGTANGSIVSMTGAASLTMDSLGTSGTLELQFAGYYDLKGNVNSTADQISGTFSTIADKGGNSKTGLNLPTNIGDYDISKGGVNEIAGASLGPTKNGTATEAVGGFILDKTVGTSVVGVRGSFGVKQ